MIECEKVDNIESIFKNRKTTQVPVQHYASEQDVVVACQHGRTFIFRATKTEISNAICYFIIAGFIIFMGFFILDYSPGVAMGYVFVVCGVIFSLCGFSGLRIFIRSFLIITPDGVGCRFKKETAFISWKDVEKVQPTRVNVIEKYGSHIEYTVDLPAKAGSSASFPTVALTYFVSKEFPKKKEIKDPLVLIAMLAYWKLNHGGEFKEGGLKDPI